MNEFVAKKMGEVLAFATVGTDTFSRGRTALAATFETSLAHLESRNEAHAAELKEIALSADVDDVLMKKHEATREKLLTMQSTYLADADDWENPAEILEWLGFFTGGAVVI